MSGEPPAYPRMTSEERIAKLETEQVTTDLLIGLLIRAFANVAPDRFEESVAEPIEQYLAADNDISFDRIDLYRRHLRRSRMDIAEALGEPS